LHYIIYTTRFESEKEVTESKNTKNKIINFTPQQKKEESKSTTKEQIVGISQSLLK